ncbi:hypothetical protein NUACC21_69230 [Scytonema sp. NUACC21]
MIENLKLFLVALPLVVINSQTSLAYRIEPHAYAEHSVFAPDIQGVKAVSNNKVDLIAPTGNSYGSFITKEIWIRIENTGVGEFIENGALAGQWGNWDGSGFYPFTGHFYGYRYCDGTGNSNCTTYYGNPYVNNPPPGYNAYEIRKIGSTWYVITDGNIISSTPFSNYQNGKRGDVGIESSDTDFSFVSGTALYNYSVRLGDYNEFVVASGIYNTDYNTYNGMRSAFSYNSATNENAISLYHN